MSKNSKDSGHEPMFAVTAAVGAGGLAIGILTLNPLAIGLSLVAITANLKENGGRVVNEDSTSDQ